MPSSSDWLDEITADCPKKVAHNTRQSLVAIFLPGILVLMGTLPFWEAFRRRAMAQAAMRGVNAAVVGLLGAALYNPVWTSAVNTPGDFGLALVGFVLLVVWHAPPFVVVAVSALGGMALALGAT